MGSNQPTIEPGTLSSVSVAVNIVGIDEKNPCSIVGPI